MKTNFSEFSDSQLEVIEKILNDQRKRKHSLRSIINAIFWINNTGTLLHDACTVVEVSAEFY